MSRLIAPVLQRLTDLTNAKMLRWEATASEDTYVASQNTQDGVLVFELTSEPRINDYGDEYVRRVLYVKRTTANGAEERREVTPEDERDDALLIDLWKLASYAQTREFLEELLSDLGAEPEPEPRPAPTPPDDYGPMGESEDPFGDQ